MSCPKVISQDLKPA